MVNIGLGIEDVASCAAADSNGDSDVTVDEIVSAVSNALDGCVAGRGSSLSDQFVGVLQ
jgi:hypothetical protein